uniref:Uncharacterized protein n=1 Tax=Oryza punctata TaxID=4537 RepID=A0A0E0JYB9_ORYPU
MKQETPGCGCRRCREHGRGVETEPERRLGGGERAALERATDDAGKEKPRPAATSSPLCLRRRLPIQLPPRREGRERDHKERESNERKEEDGGADRWARGSDGLAQQEGEACSGDESEWAAGRRHTRPGKGRGLVGQKGKEGRAAQTNSGL